MPGNTYYGAKGNHTHTSGGYRHSWRCGGGTTAMQRAAPGGPLGARNRRKEQNLKGCRAAVKGPHHLKPRSAALLVTPNTAKFKVGRLEGYLPGKTRAQFARQGVETILLREVTEAALCGVDFL